MHTAQTAHMTRTKWFIPLFTAALGVLVFVAQLIGGDPRSGLVSFAILAGFGVLVLAVITAIIVAFLVEVARGRSAAPYDWLGAIGGVAYIAAVIVLRLRG